MSHKNVFPFDHQNYLNVLKIVIPFCFLYFVVGEPAIKDRSVLKYLNPKYIGDIQVVMTRSRKSEPYKTNITVTSLQAWANNVTLKISYPLEGGKNFSITLKVCDSVDKLWMVELLRLSTNITDCPIAAGTYRYFNLGTVPKAFPTPPPSDPKSSTAKVQFLGYLTATKEVLMEIVVVVRAKKQN